MYDLDQEIGDIHGAIIEMESNILREVEQVILSSSDSIGRIADIAAEIDW